MSRPHDRADAVARARAAVTRLAHDLWGRRAEIGAGVRDRGPQIALLVGLALVVLGVAGFVGVLEAIRERDDLAELDEPVLTGLAAARSDVVTGLLTAVSVATGPVVLPAVVVLAALGWGLVGRQWWQAGLLAGAMVVSTLVSVTLKTVIARPRPPVDTMTVPGVETTFSFPSGHTIGVATLLLVVAYLAWIRRPGVRPALWWALAVALGVGLVALSRLYLGYHFVTDVVASLSLAVAVLGGVVVLDRRRAVRAARTTRAAVG